jgi:serine/threonine protein kinase
MEFSDSTSYTPRKGGHQSQRVGLGETRDPASMYDGLLFDEMRPFAQLTQAVCTYSRLRSGPFDLGNETIGKLLLFNRRVDLIGAGGTFNVFTCSMKHLPLNFGSKRGGIEVSTGPGELVVLKSIRALSLDPPNPADLDHGVRNFIKELQILCHPPLRAHPNLPDILGIAWQDSSDEKVVWPVICCEYAEFGTVSAYLRTKTNLPCDERAKIAFDIGIGLHALHMCGIVHGDVKCENALLFRDPSSKTGMTAKISDFADAWIKADVTKASSIRVDWGTWRWASPEFGKEVPLSQLHLMDTFSFGLLVWRIMLNGESPFTRNTLGSWLSVREGFGKSEQDLYHELKSGPDLMRFALAEEFPRCEASLAAGVKILFQETLTPDATKRVDQLSKTSKHLKTSKTTEEDHLRYIEYITSERVLEEQSNNVFVDRNLMMMMAYQRKVSVRYVPVSSCIPKPSCFMKTAER